VGVAIGLFLTKTCLGHAVFSLMWLRTTMNYQYRHGTTTREALKHLWKEGGVVRFYRGLTPALLQGPLSRFGDTASNAGVLALLDHWPSTRDLPVAFKTACASTAAAAFRIVLMPIDTLKTTLQVEGAKGLTVLGNKMRTNGPTVMFHGALGAFAATWVGHFPWFFTYNYLDAVIPKYDTLAAKLARNAGIGFVATCVSDTSSNSIRVLKTYRQTSEVKISYLDAARNVIAKDGWVGLFGRGLGTRLLANGMQGAMFSMGWKYFQILYAEAEKRSSSQDTSRA
jgi:hypothetical protein